MTEHDDLDGVLACYPLQARQVQQITTGHINLTFKVEAAEGELILQRLHPVFGPEVHLDIETITAHLAGQGMTTPRLLRTLAGELWTTDGENRVWRVLTFVPGEVVPAADSPARCRAAGRFLGRFHAALWGLRHDYAHRRPGVHDTPQHLERLAAAIDAHPTHRVYDRAAPLAEAILDAAGSLALPPGLPLRHVHGDPKISNFVFASGVAVRALIDFDTLGAMPLPLDLGDALRSWCSPRGEEVGEPIDTEHFRAAIEGYATEAGPLLSEPEREAIAPTTALIAFDLASRFCTDALEERYFAWDRQRFPSASEHHLARATAQLALGRSVMERLGELAAIVRESWRQLRLDESFGDRSGTC